jgi:hypothetical protein
MGNFERAHVDSRSTVRIAVLDSRFPREVLRGGLGVVADVDERTVPREAQIPRGGIGIDDYRRDRDVTVEADVVRVLLVDSDVVDRVAVDRAVADRRLGADDGDAAPGISQRRVERDDVVDQCRAVSGVPGSSQRESAADVSGVVGERVAAKNRQRVVGVNPPTVEVADVTVEDVVLGGRPAGIVVAAGVRAPEEHSRAIVRRSVVFDEILRDRR